MASNGNRPTVAAKCVSHGNVTGAGRSSRVIMIAMIWAIAIMNRGAGDGPAPGNGDSSHNTNASTAVIEGASAS